MYVFIKDYIVRLLEDKVAYLRHRGTRGRRNKGQPYNKRRSSVYAPDPPALPRYAGYDDNSAAYGRNLKMLQEEEKKPTPDKEVVMDLMKKTFFIRRQNILKIKTPVASLLKMFPSLRNEIQVSLHAEIIGRSN